MTNTAEEQLKKANDLYVSDKMIESITGFVPALVDLGY